MRIESREDREKRKKKQKKQEDWLTAQINAILEKSLETAMKQVIDDLFKDWK